MANSITTKNSSSFLSLTNVADKSVNAQPTSASDNAAFVATEGKLDQFSSSISSTDKAISDIDSKIKGTKDDTKRQELIARKQNLGNQKKELESKQEVLKGKMSKIKSDLSTHKTAADKVKSELDKLNSNKASLEKTMKNENKELVNKSATLKNINGNIGETRLELDATIESLNKSVDDMTKNSEAELNQQRSAISAATTEALGLVQNGEITSEEMPSYIAGRINNFNSVGNTTSGAAVVDSNNTKIKSLCSQLSGYVDQQGAMQLSIKASSNKVQSVSPLFEALNAEIKAKSSEFASAQGLVNASQSEFTLSNKEYNHNDLQITDLGSQLAEVDTQISVAEVPAVDPAAAPAAETQAQAQAQTQTQTPVAEGTMKYNQFFVSNDPSTPKIEINFDDEMSKINSDYAQTLKEDVKNTEVENLKSKMDESDKLITTLRSHLSDNAQKIIQERLDATKRK